MNELEVAFSSACRLTAEAEAELSVLEERLEQLVAERYGLALALSRRTLAAAAPTPPPTANASSRKHQAPRNKVEAREIRELGISDAITAVLDRAGQPMRTPSIIEALATHGKATSAENVRTSMSTLHRKKRITRLRTGVYLSTLVDPSTVSVDPPRASERDESAMLAGAVLLQQSRSRPSRDVSAREGASRPVRDRFVTPASDTGTDQGSDVMKDRLADPA